MPHANRYSNSDENSGKFINQPSGMTEIAAIIEEEKEEYDLPENVPGAETTFLQEFEFGGKDEEEGVSPYYVHGAMPEHFEEDPMKDSLGISRNV